LRRREALALLGGAAAGLPLAARAQQRSVPVVGFLRNASSETSTHLIAAFREGLSEAGYIEGRSVAIEYRWAEGQYDRLPLLAVELVHLGAAVIFAGGTGEARAAKAATGTIPIVFSGASDPVAVGLVSSFNRPGGNLTGSTMISHSLGAKRLELLWQLIPNVKLVALLINPNNPSAASEVESTQAAARAIGLRVVLLKASSEPEVSAALVAAVQNNAGAVVVAGDPLFTAQGYRVAALALQHKLPTIYTLREYAESGGLISYGTSFANSYRDCGAYVGRILRGEKPGDLPVLQPTKFEMVINLKTARALGVAVPATLLATADEVIE